MINFDQIQVFVFGYNNCLMEPNIEIVFVKKWSL
jgi:hypothetical protein